MSHSDYEVTLLTPLVHDDGEFLTLERGATLGNFGAARITW